MNSSSAAAASWRSCTAPASPTSWWIGVDRAGKGSSTAGAPPRSSPPLSRPPRETLALVDHAQRHGARVHVGDLGILDPDDPTGTFTLTVLSGANKLTRDMARQLAKEQVMVRR